MNTSEKIVAERYEADGYTVIKEGMPDLVAVKDHSDYWELVFDEVKTNRQPLQRNQKRAIAILKKLEGKPVYVSVKRSRILTKDLSPQTSPCHISPGQSSPIQANLAQKVEQDRPFTLDFLKGAAIDAETLDEFILALRSYKEIQPLALISPLQTSPAHSNPSQPSPSQASPHHSSLSHSTPIQTISGGGELDEM